LASGTPVKFWRTIIEPNGLRQGRNHKKKTGKRACITLACSGRRLITLPGFKWSFNFLFPEKVHLKLFSFKKLKNSTDF